MTTKKTNPTNQATTCAKVAVTLPTGSRLGEASVAAVHDLVGIALLIVPPELRAALGDKDLLSGALELETQEILVIVREANVVAYVHLPIIVKELEYPAAGLQDGMVLKDITASIAKKAGEKREETLGKRAPKTAQSALPKKPAKPTGKGGRRA